MFAFWRGFCYNRFGGDILKKIHDAKEKIYQFILSEIDRKGFPPTVREICDGVGLASPASVHRYLRILAEEGLLRVDPNKKRAYTVPDYRRDKTASLPLLGKVAAGLPILAHENREDVFPVPSMLLHGLRSDAFMLRVDGESMKNAGICDRDIIVVELGTVPKDGDIVVARVNSEEVTVKRFFQKGKEIELRPENEAFTPMVYPIDQVEILGCVTGLMRSY